MGLAEIWDAIARQAAGVSGIKAAYATKQGGQGATVRLYPDDITDGPVAVIDYTGSEMLTVGPFEHVAHDFAIGIWMPYTPGARGNAVSVLAPMFERFVVTFRANVGLYGTAMQSQIQGSSGFDDDRLTDQPDKNYLVQRIAIRAQEARSVTPSLGPSS